MEIVGPSGDPRLAAVPEHAGNRSHQGQCPFLRKHGTQQQGGSREIGATAKWVDGTGFGAGCINPRGRLKNVPQGLKPRYLCAFCGTAEAVPFYKTIYASSSVSAEAARLLPVESS
jgi:hypothetical protein